MTDIHVKNLLYFILVQFLACDADGERIINSHFLAPNVSMSSLIRRRGSAWTDTVDVKVMYLHDFQFSFLCLLAAFCDIDLCGIYQK